MWETMGMTTNNPYIAGLPLREDKSFFGRQDLSQWVERELSNRNNNSLVLFGQRRIGKTSLLLHLERSFSSENFLPVYFDLHHMACLPLGRVLAALAESTARRAGMDEPVDQDFDDQGRFFTHSFLPALYERLGEQCRPVFLLDEFDVLDQVVVATLPETAASRTLFHFLREVMGADHCPAFVFVVGRQADDLSQDYQAAFRTAQSREVWVLQRNSAIELVRQAEVNGTLRFSEQAVERILSLTSGHPFLIQALCYQLWNRAHTCGSSRFTFIDREHVEAAIAEMLQERQSALYWIWNGLRLSTQFSTAVLADCVSEAESISKENMIALLKMHAAQLVPWFSESVDSAPLDLEKQRIMVAEGETYRFAVELFRRWVRERQPMHKVKEEINSKPVAEILFSAGQQYLAQERIDDAIRSFRFALDSDPGHFQSQLQLGKALLRRGWSDEAVVELEKAFGMNQDEVRYSLVYALVVQAQELQAAGEMDRAFKVCERALEVSPDTQKAQEIRNEILLQRGQKAQEQQELEKALLIYREIGAEQKAREAQLLLEKRAQRYEQAGELAEAVKIYQLLLDKTQEKRLRSRWEAALERIREMQKTTSGHWAVDYVLDGKYRIIRLLAETRRSEVYETEELQPPRHILIVKRLKPDKIHDEDVCKRFEREVIALRKIHHQFVLSLYDSKTTGRERYLVTESADGGTLEDYVDARPGGKLSPMAALEIGLSICQGLEAVHRQNIVHRDIKPGNIFLFHQRDGSVMPKLADFSIAYIPEEFRDDGKLTETGSFMGTPNYASPEQLLGDKADLRSDLYSWALVLFQMLTGESPDSLRGANMFHEPLASLDSSILMEEWAIPRELAEILGRNLSADRSQRHQSAVELRQALEVVRAQVERELDSCVHEGERLLQSCEWPAAVVEFERGLALGAWYGPPFPPSGPVGAWVDRLHTGQLFAQAMLHWTARRWQPAVEILESLPRVALARLDLEADAPLQSARAEWAREQTHQHLVRSIEQQDWPEAFRQMANLLVSYDGNPQSTAVADLGRLTLSAWGKKILAGGDYSSVYQSLAEIYDRLGDSMCLRGRFVRAGKYWRASLRAHSRIQKAD